MSCWKFIFWLKKKVFGLINEIISVKNTVWYDDGSSDFDFGKKTIVSYSIIGE